VTTASFGAGGATVAGAAILLSVSGDVVSDTKCFGNSSEGIGVGLQLASVATGVTGAAVGALATGATAASKTAMGVGAALTGLGGESEAVAGGAHIENQDFAATVQSAAADAQHAVNQNAELEQTVSSEIDDLKASDKTHEGAKQATADAIHESDHSTAAAAACISVKG